jgi:hypothetical protein
VHNQQPPWQLRAFLERLDDWAQREYPSDELRRLVTAWILSRYDDPYQGVRREPGFDNLWFGKIPGSHRSGDGTVVTCSYFINEATHTVQCDNFGTLNLPA